MEGQRWRVLLSDVDVDDGLLACVTETVASGWWSMGPRVEEFESEFASFCGTRHAVAVANGTAALHLALLAAGVGPGDEVILPSLNFVAAANTICHTGAHPVFCDIVGADDLNLDPVDVERAVGPATKAIVALHYGGHPCDMSALARIAKRHGLVVIEDAAHAPGASWRGRPCGAIGGVGCFSFFSNKNLPVGEGGMIVTSDDELAARLRLLRSHGMTTLTWARHRGHATSYDVLTQGFNYRLDEIHAAVGLHQLRALPARNAARGRLAAAYADALHDRAGIVVPFVHPRADADPAHHIAVVCLPQRADRDDVRAALQKAGIQTSVHYPPIHTFTAYADLPRRRALPRTDEISSRILTLPLHPGLGDEDVELVTTSLLEAVALAAAA